MDPVIIDVREPDEFDAQHVTGSVLVPLSRFDRSAPGVLRLAAGRKILLLCRSGHRAELARLALEGLGFGGRVDAQVFPGGILEWARQGKPVVTRAAARLPIMRQVHLVAGGVVLSAALLSLYADRRAAWLAVLVGAGLLVSGATGFCGLAKVLALMPWNKLPAEAPED